MVTRHLVTGGARAGKSRFVLDAATRHAAACAPGSTVAFIATARAGDDDMAARIARHRAERGATFVTVEEPLELGAALLAASDGHVGVVVDCLTVWLAQALFDDETRLPERCEALRQAVAASAVPVWLVTNEVGLGIHPEHALSRRYVDLLGRLNQDLAVVCNRVTLVACGLPLHLKGGAAGDG